MSSWLYVPVFTFLFLKIVTQGQLCQQLVKPVAYMCFLFSACKNYSIRESMPAVKLNAIVAAMSNSLYILVFAFLFVKIVT